MKREFLQLAQTYDPKKHYCSDMWVSEKLDGIRAFWDGGISRGVAATDVPYANCRKHDRFKIPQIATGLWTRYAQPIQAPAWFLDALPKVPLDGELWLGFGAFEQTTSITKRHVPDSRWEGIKYKVFDIPPLGTLLEDGSINNPNCKMTLTGCIEWAANRSVGMCVSTGMESNFFIETTPYYKIYSMLGNILEGNKVAERVQQDVLPLRNIDAIPKMDEMLQGVLSKGGEGLMLRRGIGFYRCERSWNILKVKPFNDLEVKVIGYRWGKPTDTDRSVGPAQDRMLGKMGAAIVQMQNGKIFDLGSGFTMEQRTIDSSLYTWNEIQAVGEHSGGEKVPEVFTNRFIPVGTEITIKYRELSADGIPKEARFWRKV